MFKLALSSKLESKGMTVEKLSNVNDEEIRKEEKVIMDPILIDTFTKCYGVDGKMNTSRMRTLRSKVRGY